MPENVIDPMAPSRVERLRAAPRCGAKTRAGTPCQGPVVRGRRRCKFHGGASPGGPYGEANGRYRHGLRTKEYLTARALAAAYVRLVREVFE